MSDLLFWSGELRGWLENERARMAAEIQAAPPDHVREADAEAWADALAEKYAVQTPVLDRDGIWQEEAKEIKVDVTHDFMRAVTPGSRALINGYRVVVHLPFEGEADVFKLQASSYTMNPPQGTIRGQEIITVLEYPHDRPADIKGHATALADSLDKHLAWSDGNIQEHNSSLRAAALNVILTKKEQIEKHEAHMAETGLPVGPPSQRKKTYITDALVRLPSPRLPQKKNDPVKLEPVLGDEVFEHILGVVRAKGEMMEASPQTYTELGEEDLRQHIVSTLHTHYQGKTTAEAFNFTGKTDILVKHEGANLFIGECKFWSGPQGFEETIDQLFRYTAWRDTKLAIVMFVREKSLTALLKKARKTLQDHECFSGWGEAATDQELRARVTWPGDNERYADLNVFFVHVPAK